MVSSPTWSPRQRRWYSRQMHQVLEYPHSFAHKPCGNRLSGMQSHVLKKCQRACEHPWLLPESNLCLEIPLNEKASYLNRPHNEGSIPCVQPRWANTSYWSRRRDFKILECFSPKEVSKISSLLHSTVGDGPQMIM